MEHTPHLQIHGVLWRECWKYIRQGLIYSGIFILSMSIFILIRVILFRVSPLYYELASFTISLGLIIIAYDPIKNVIAKGVNAMFSSNEVDYRRFLKTFSSALITIVDLNKLSEIIVKTLYDFYELTGGAILLFNEVKNVCLIAYAKGDVSTQASLDMYNPLVVYLKENPSLILLSKLRPGKHEYLVDVMHEFKAELCLPMIFRGKFLGVLFLGKKRSGKPFTADDEDSFITIESQITVALNNAILFKSQKESQVLLAQKNKMDAIIALSSGINHEINNPLSIISMRCQNFLRKLASGKYVTASDIVKNAQEVIESSLRNANRAHMITKRLANFAKPSQESLNFQAIRVKECIQECIDLIGKKQFFGDNIMINIDVPDAVPAIYADRVQFQQILYNMIMNAYHAIDKNGTLTFKAYEKGTMRVCIEITDTGCGISPEHLSKIWEPFFTTKPTNPLPGQKATGSGLGLALVKRYVEESGGTIDVKSKLGAGTTFVLTMVRAPEEAGEGSNG